ncbi:glycoside hydrolase family 52 protein [Streptomyces sp. NPDC019224]|uniref:glycoside hydrolase family 52 protein n=1 Tax=Streptomyces sp. NPDC019224 TaxID=3154484 RepID=UPI0034061EF8
MTDSTFYNTHHSPAGAFASFTLGHKGPTGGFGLELTGPARENVWVGAESSDHSCFEALPFFTAPEDDRARFAAQGPSVRADRPVRPFADTSIRRTMDAGSDTWQAGDLTFALHSPPGPLPDPDQSDPESTRTAFLPAVFAELTLDNTRGTTPRRVFFGYQGSDRTRGMRHLEPNGPLRAGVGQGRTTALATGDDHVRSAIGFDLEDILSSRDGSNWDFGIGTAAALVTDVPPGQRRTLRVAVCFYQPGTVTTGLEACYLYSRHFAAIEDVAVYAISHFGRLVRRCTADAASLTAPHLSGDQQFMLNHAVRGYFASTQALVSSGRALWVVNEGEYRMMNTFDLTADHVFFEARQNPWTLRNVLDLYADRYAYHDQVKFPGETETHPGGIAFTHDMGHANAFSPPGRSAYERSGSSGLFSHMSHEQLVNWILCAGVYAHSAPDPTWVRDRKPILEQCLQSLLNRDHPDPALRDGVMSLDSCRCSAGSEITTYDSLDPSLGQARRNTYLAVKTFAAYVWLSGVLDAAAAETAGSQARRCADALLAHRDGSGIIPALLEKDAAGTIIPVIEGLAHVWAAGRGDALSPTGPFADLVAALRVHTEAVLTSQACLFPDGGWKLSADSDNSWLSKIYLCQFVARHLLGFRSEASGHKADMAHRSWLLSPANAVWCWSDQMSAGTVVGSRYYPRGVTAALWLNEAPTHASGPVSTP